MGVKRLGMRILKITLYFFAVSILCFVLQEFYIIALLAPLSGVFKWLNIDILTTVGNILGFIIHVLLMLRYVNGLAIDDIQERKYRPQIFHGEYVFSWLFTFAPLLISAALETQQRSVFIFLYSPFFALAGVLNNEYILAALPFFAIEATILLYMYGFTGKRYIEKFEKEHGECVYYE